MKGRTNKETRNIDMLYSNYRKLSINDKVELVGLFIDFRDEEQLDMLIHKELGSFMFIASWFWNTEPVVAKRKELAAFIEKAFSIQGNNKEVKQ